MQRNLFPQIMHIPSHTMHCYSRIDQEKQLSVVELKIRKDIKIYDDASASIKTSDLIGDKFIKVDPGGGGTILKRGQRISETNSPIDVGDLIGKYAFGGIKQGDKKETN